MTRAALITSALLVVGAGLVQAQSLNISQQCQSTFIGIAVSPESACLNIGGLASLLTTSANSSLVPGVDSWLKGVCAASPCTDQQLSDIVSNITSGCGNDLASFGLTPNNASVVSAIEAAYPTVRQIGCLKDTTNNTLCLTTTLDNVESVLGPLSLDNIMTQMTEILTGQATNLPTSLVCTDCSKAAFNILKQNDPALPGSSTVTNAVENQCGASFVDGTSPTEVLEGTGSAAPTGTANGAASMFPLQTRMVVLSSSLAAVFTAFAVLA